MRDILLEIRTSLYQNAALLTLLKGKRVYILTAPKGDEYPRIVLTELPGTDTDFADDEATASEYRVQVSVFSKDSDETLSIAREAHKTLKAQEWGRYIFDLMYEDDTRIFQRVMRYTNTLSEEET